MKTIFNTFFWILLVAQSAIAQNSVVSFKHITTNDGLSQSTVTSILQDDQGFIWFGTHDGLNRYDGKTIKVYKNDPANPKSLSNNFINALLMDRSGNIWIGSNEGGLIYFDLETETFTAYKYIDKDSVTSIRVNCVEQDSDGNLWVGTYEHGLNYFDVKSKRFTTYMHDPADST